MAKMWDLGCLAINFFKEISSQMHTYSHPFIVIFLETLRGPKRYKKIISESYPRTFLPMVLISYLKVSTVTKILFHEVAATWYGEMN